MKRSVTLLCCVVLLLGGCKGRAAVPAAPTPSPTPVPTAITVTVLQGGTPQVNLPVVESSDYNATTGTPVGTIATVNTNANGVASFTLPTDISTQYCFSTSVTVTGQTFNYHVCQQPLSNYTITLGS